MIDKKNIGISTIIVVAALGYFVDIYDLILFGVVRNPSLIELGYSGEQLVSKGVFLFNFQMLGMLIGGVLWGVLGDKKGRVSVLFGSIFMYSAANILNGFVTNINVYGLLRFVAGIGLAGELGAGITLVTESMPIEKRGWGTTIIVTFGALGAVVAALVADNFDWRTSYFVGGGLGIILLFLRVGIFESGMYKKMTHDESIFKGDFFKLFSPKERFLKYLSCILVGLPIWFTIGILIIFSPEIGTALGLPEKVNASQSIMFAYIGLSLGDLLSGTISQLLRSRRKVVFSFIIALICTIGYFFFGTINSMNGFYLLCFALGVSSGYWALFVTIAAEQFGTNLRSTVTSTVPNFVRGAVIPITSAFLYIKGHVGIVNSSLIVGAICILLAIIGMMKLNESFTRNLSFYEK
ncbi:MAG: MFS transporter [Saprospiraceae bacterium]|nr:MFS transporter [Saprospiraceae bacterium]